MMASPREAATDPVPAPAPAPAPDPSRHPTGHRTITDACAANDVARVRQALEAAPSRRFNEKELRVWAIRRAVWNGAADVVRFLLELDRSLVEALTPDRVAEARSSEVFQILLDHGWDIDAREPDQGNGWGRRLMQLVCHDETLVRWCLDHGASVTDDHTDPYRCPPILETVAAVGTIDTFKLLRARGAQPGRRTLHRAVESAAAAGRDPPRGPPRMAMVKYLVDEVGLDVNGLDTDEKLPNHWGTPLCYAIQILGDMEEVVTFLLDRGADPWIEDCWGGRNAVTLAEFYKRDQIAQLLREKRRPA